MTGIIKIIGVVGLFACLLVMYMTDHGIRGIQKYDPSFRLLDMRFRYSSATVEQTFAQIGREGRTAYKKYLVLDFIFIAFLLVTMITVTDAVYISARVRIILYIICGMRALFDIIENLLLLRLLEQFPSLSQTMAEVCSWFTTFKFIMLYLWLTGLLLKAAISLVKYVGSHL